MPTSYRLDCRPVANPAAVVQGDRYRITVLTDGLLRLEYAADGKFVDEASAFALKRDLPVPEYSLTETNDQLVIVTDRLRLFYDKQPFSANGLTIQVRGNVSSYHSVWRYGEEPDDLGGTARTLDEADGAVPLEHGIISRWGFGIVDDSRTLLLTKRTFTDDPNARKYWVKPRDGERIDLYFFGYGHDYREALRAFYSVAGATPVLPRFALGNWWSRFYPYTADQYLALMDRFRDEGIPLSVAVIDMDWHLVEIDSRFGSGWTGYTWNTDLFSDPDAFLASLHDRGLRVTLNVHPADGVRAHEEAYRAMADALGVDAAAGEPIAFDVTNPHFLDAYFNILHRPLEEHGVDFWWIDWQSGGTSRIAGIDPLWMLNHFHFFDSARDDGPLEGRPLTFSRYAGPGSHRYPIGFSGDTVVSWASLEFQPYFTATASNLGFGWWSHDIGGHMFGIKDDELAARWVQLGVYSPIMRLHSSENVFNTKEPWHFSAEAQAAMTGALRMRHRLIPYLHTMNWRAAREAIPLVQPMYYEHPNVAEAYDVPNQFLFGTELVVAPITSPRDRRLQLGKTKAWLPPGTWVDLATGMAYDGGRMINLHRGLDSIPVLARAGAILPLAGDDAIGNDTGNPRSLEVLVVAGADGEFVLREEDGHGDGLDEQRWVRTRMHFDDEHGVFTVDPAEGNYRCLPATRQWVVSLTAFEEPKSVTAQVDGREVEVQADAQPAGFGRRLSVTLDDVPVDASVRVDLGGHTAVRSNEVSDRIFALLSNAQIEYDLKTAGYKAVSAAPSAGSAVGQLLAMDVEPDLVSAMSELLLARTDPG
jgi:alpha-glucosidase (family GH31 glycosyl hydrolase)